MLLDLFSGKSREPAECVIRISGEEIVHLYPHLAEVKASTTRRDGAQATLTFQTRRDEEGSWLVQDDEFMQPWAPIEILAKFGESEQEVMSGFIKKIASSYPSDASSTTVTVECQDASILLDRTHRRRIWGADVPTTDLLIITEILSDTEIIPHPETAGESELVLNQNKTDIRFLRERATQLGYDLIFHDGTLYFGPFRLDGEPQETILVYGGPDTQCANFSIDEDGHLPDAVSFDVAPESGSDAIERTLEPDQTLLGPDAASSQNSGLSEFAWRLDREGETSESDLEALAQAKANENAFKIKASGDLDGSLYGYVLRVGETVGVDGLGERHSGIYYVDQVEHSFSVTGYKQSFQLLRNATGDNLESAPGSALAAL